MPCCFQWGEGELSTAETKQGSGIWAQHETKGFISRTQVQALCYRVFLCCFKDRDTPTKPFCFSREHRNPPVLAWPLPQHPQWEQPALCSGWDQCRPLILPAQPSHSWTSAWVLPENTDNSSLAPTFLEGEVMADSWQAASPSHKAQ